MLPKSICFVDLETTGTQAHWDKVIEIGILKITNGKVVKKYKQLVNPQTHIDPFIQNLTGITKTDLESAPTFAQIRDEVLDILKNSTFVAHNVRFDYGFIKNEFKRHEISFRTPHFCTIKLARILYPHLGHYNLDSVIAHLGIKCTKRHRAFDDAKAIWDFYKIAQKQFKQTEFEKAVALALNKPTLPSGISQKLLDSLPESPGVYTFYGQNNAPLYIGKSLNIYDRVLSHFSSDYESETDMQIRAQTTHIESIQTAGELGALLLESALIKKHKPILNKRLRQAPKIYIFKSQTKKGYNFPKLLSLPNLSPQDAKNVVGAFKTKRQAQNHIITLTREHKLCASLMGLERSNTYCFAYHLGKCKGACMGEEKPIAYNLRFDHAYYKTKIKPWKWNKPIVIKEIGEKEEHFIIDKWCHVASIKSREETQNIEFNYNFDMDTYKILNKFMTSPKNFKKFQMYPYQEQKVL